MNVPIEPSFKEAESPLSALSPSSDELSDVPLRLPSVVDVGIEEGPAREESLPLGRYHRFRMIVLCISVMICGALNNVLGKIRSKPLGACNYFVSIINALAYSLVYVVIMKIQQYRGIIKQEEIDFVWKTRCSRYNVQESSSSLWSNFSRPLLRETSNSNTFETTRWERFRERVRLLGAWKYFIATGLCDFCGNILGMISQPFVPGPLFALVNQATLPAAAVVSYIILRRRYSACQLLAILCVWIGGAIALLPELFKLWRQLQSNEAEIDKIRPTEGDFGNQASLTIKYTALVVVGTVPTALSSAFKEKVFKLYSKRQRRSQLPINNDCGRATGLALASHPELRARQMRPGSDNARNNMFKCSKSEGSVLSDCEMDDAFNFTVIEDERRPIKPLDIFIISAYGSLFQLLFVPLAFPINRLLGQFGHHSFFTFVSAGISCVLGNSEGNASLCHVLSSTIGIKSGGGVEPSECWTTDSRPCESYGCCRWAPLSYLPYLIVNIVFNILLLYSISSIALSLEGFFFLVLIVHGSAIIAFMTLKAILPLAILLFAIFQWPLLSDADTQVSPTILVSLIIVSLGIWWYRRASQKASNSRNP